VMVPELEMVLELEMPLPAVFDIVMMPVAVLLMVPPGKRKMPWPMPDF